jgi:hypothetical protein
MKSLFSTYKSLIVAAFATASLSSCALEVVNPPVQAQLMVVNLAPAASSATVGVPSLQISVDNVNILSDSLRNNALLGYIGFDAGTRNVKLTARNNNSRFNITAGKEYGNFSYNGVVGEYTSAFLIPSVATNDRFEVITGKDNITRPAAGSANVRFVHAVPNVAEVDIWLSAGPSVPAADSARIYRNPIVRGVKFKDISNFITLPAVPVTTGTPLPPRQNYTFVVRAAGSTATSPAISTIVANSTSTANSSTTPHILESTRVMTIAITGATTRLSILNDR